MLAVSLGRPTKGPYTANITTPQRGHMLVTTPEFSARKSLYFVEPFLFEPKLFNLFHSLTFKGTSMTKTRDSMQRVLKFH